jgi:phosphatidylglycerol:prolipoprotein diacylglycerol transferase
MMLDPVIFSIEIFGFTLALHWYGVLIMAGVVVGTFIASREVKRRGGDPNLVWEVLAWILVAAVIGARLWFVATDILGGSRRYLENPASIIGIAEGGLRGLHIYGAILFGAIAAYVWARRNRVDLWLILDSAGIPLLIGQALARPANYINQELYGHPTDLPWGIQIDAAHRLGPWRDTNQYPVETTRFHPTFAYEMAVNVLVAGLILWLTRRFWDRLRPGVAFGLWLILAGLGRFIIEFFRPDQPRIPGTGLSFTRTVNVLMMLAGVLLILVKYEVLRLPFLSAGSTAYAIQPAPSAEAGTSTETPD